MPVGKAGLSSRDLGCGGRVESVKMPVALTGTDLRGRKRHPGAEVLGETAICAY